MLSTKSLSIVKFMEGEREIFFDDIAVEEPLEIQIQYFIKDKIVSQPLSVTLRTPGHDDDLVLGFLLSEKIIHKACEVEYLRAHPLNSSKITVQLKKGVDIDFEKLQRHFYTTSSCGVCGKASIEAIKVNTDVGLNDNTPEEISISAELIYKLPYLLLDYQEKFCKTGGMHASAVFNLDGECLLIREDVGRHNALDKLIGALSLAPDLSAQKLILVLSGRVSFELIQKASIVGFQIIIAIGAPSSLAIDLAQEFFMTLVGFTKSNRFNIYAGERRIKNSGGVKESVQYQK